MTYNFDEIIDRRNTNSENVEGWRPYIFHCGPERVFPYKDEEFIRMWVADMEFAVAPEILQAIRCHVTGATNMSTLDKVLYVADYVEPGRRFQGIAEVRGALKRGGLDACILAGLKLTIEDLMHRNLLLHPRSVEAYNAFVGKG